jgi:hypothetical protein
MLLLQESNFHLHPKAINDHNEQVNLFYLAQNLIPKTKEVMMMLVVQVSQRFIFFFFFFFSF